MAESPLIQELLAERTQENIIRVLTRRCGAVPPEVAVRVRRVRRDKQLGALLAEAAVAADLSFSTGFLGSALGDGQEPAPGLGPTDGKRQRLSLTG